MRHPFRTLAVSLLAACALCACAGRSHAADTDWGTFQFGVSAHYWLSIEEASNQDGFENNGLAWGLSARIMPSWLVHLGLEVEQFPERYAALEDDMYAPAAYLIVGRSLYAAVGMGCYYYDNTFYTDPFYALRAGLMVEFMPSLILDLNANYRLEEIGAMDDAVNGIDTDTITLGAALRLRF